MNVWENVLTGKGSSAISQVIDQVARLNVHGGWLVRSSVRETIMSMGRQQIIFTMNTTFVPDKDHEWKIKDDEEIVKNLIKKGEENG